MGFSSGDSFLATRDVVVRCCVGQPCTACTFSKLLSGWWSWWVCKCSVEIFLVYTLLRIPWACISVRERRNNKLGHKVELPWASFSSYFARDRMLGRFFLPMDCLVCIELYRFVCRCFVRACGFCSRHLCFSMSLSNGMVPFLYKNCVEYR